jgi:ABC-2 type transport system ATP-binding protein
MSILSIQALSKTYPKNIKAVDQLNLEVQKGTIFGILGPNGSGKTTTLAMILGIIHPTSGHYRWFDKPEGYNSRKRIGAILETPNFYPYLNAQKNLEIIAHIKKSSPTQIPELLELVGLADRKNALFSTFSLGMKQRLAIAAALIGDPDVLIFDEPTNGLDPQGIVEVRNLLIEIGKQGKTILLASHIIDEVEKVCDHVAIIKFGRLLVAGKVSDILNDNPLTTISSDNIQALNTALKDASFVQSMQVYKDRIELRLIHGFSPTELNRYLYEKGIVLSQLIQTKKSLEAEFLERTN